MSALCIVGSCDHVSADERSAQALSSQTRRAASRANPADERQLHGRLLDDAEHHTRRSTDVFELIANHAIVWGVTTWLGTMAAMLLAWAGGMFYIRAQEERVVQDPVLMDMLRWRTRPVLFQTLGGGGILVVFTIATHFASAVGVVAVGA